jgi:diguanylate cyclase (GGDEF)-like protein
MSTSVPPATDLAEETRSAIIARLMRPTVQTARTANLHPVVDRVTGLPGRIHLHSWAAEAIEHSRPADNRALVAFIDIGLLRDVNDSFGLDAGDALLRAIGERLSTIDLPGTRVLRYEGAELVVVFEQILHYDEAEEIARFLIDLLSPPFKVGDETISITPYVGAALSTDIYATTDEFIRDAHRALVRARDGGAGSYALHDESKRGHYETRVDESRLSDAIANREFLLVYQPIIRLDTGTVIGAEALLRWKAPNATNTGLLFPRDFMPLLEKSGLAVKVGEWVIREGCRQAVQWNRLLPDRPALFITCNVGARQLASPDFVEHVSGAIAETGVNPWQLCLDITEQALRFNRSEAWVALRELKDMGVKLGLDDFGTGVSSMTYLREFSLDLLRIDRVFVTDLEQNNEDRVIVKHIAGLAHDLGLVAIAEGVENAGQAELLAELGVDLAQGYHFGRPVFAADILRKLGSQPAP